MKNKVLNILTDNYIIFCVYALIGWIYEVSWYLIVRHKFVNRGVLFGPFLPIYGFGVLILLLLLRKFMSKRHETSNSIYLSLSVFTITTFIYTTVVEYTTPKIYSVVEYFANYGIGLIASNLVILLIVYMCVKNVESLKSINLNVVLVFLSIWIITTVVEYISHYFIDTCFHKLLWDYSKDFLNINSRVNWDASRNFAIGGTLLLYSVQPFIDKFLKKNSLKVKIIITLIIGIPMLIDIFF